MFHRVLPAGSAAMTSAEREYAMSLAGFRRCLDFIVRHYAVVDLARLTNPQSLPRCPALISFDDGWADTLEFAAPELTARGLPACVFLAPEGLLEEGDRWWADALSAALGSGHAGGLGDGAAPAPDETHAMHAMYAAMDPDRRWRTELLDPAAAEGRRQLLSESDLPRLTAARIDVGGHGYTHGPLTLMPQPERELNASAAWLRRQGVTTLAMSFPHGAWSPALCDAAARAGFEWLFNSEPVLNRVPLAGGSWPAVLGRIHVPENQWTCDDEGVSFARLASFFFFRGARPARSPAQG